jgi:trimethylamine--corrinoid protein Co-methyltransferase
MFRTQLNVLKGLDLRVLSSDELDLVHDATVKVLWKTGLAVETDEAADIYHSAGCTVERGEKRHIVKIPPYLVEDCIGWAPRSFVFYGRNPAKDFVVESGRLGFSFFGENVNIIDIETRKVRNCTKKDLGDASRLGDYYGDVVPFIHKCMGSLDQMAATHSLHNYHAMVTNSDKHVVQGFFSGRNTKKIFEMAAACCGGMENFKKRPIVTNMVCPTSPLILTKNVCDMTVECARMGTGVIGTTMPLSGVTAPSTPAGALVIANAELLGILVLSQIICRGLPYMFANYQTNLDLKIGTACLGAPEAGLLAAATAQICKYYQLPVWCGVGVSDSKVPEAQAAYENAINATMAALGGASIIDCIGGLESGLTFDYAKAVMDIEYARGVMKVAEGIEVNDETLATEAIDQVGHCGGYLTADHTLRNMRSMFQAQLFDRNSRESWITEAGGKDVTERAYEMARHIVATHEPAPLPPGVDEQMTSIIEEYEKEISRGN